MNTLRNSVRLVGNLGMDPEVKVYDTDKKMVKLSVATKDSYKNDKGERITDTTWHNLVFWGVQAKLAEDFLKKGDEVTIEGKLTNRNYVDKDGIKRYTSEIVVNEFLKVGAKGWRAKAVEEPITPTEPTIVDGSIDEDKAREVKKVSGRWFIAPVNKDDESGNSRK